jgi:hypothetical protein
MMTRSDFDALLMLEVMMKILVAYPRSAGLMPYKLRTQGKGRG